MKKTHILLSAVMTIFMLGTASARADIIDFVQLTESGPLGESGWSSLNLSYTGFDVSITGDNASGDAFAYLDWNHAGLGVCGNVYSSEIDEANPGSGSNVCNPSSDDNVTVGESLTFSFSTAVTIEKIWFNNTHDPDFTIDAGDLITINGLDYAGPGNGYAPTSSGYNTTGLAASVDNYLGGFTAGPGSDLVIAFNNEQFYISGMEVSVAVPAPATILLLGLGLVAAGVRRKK